MKGHALRLADGLARIGQKLVEGELLGNGAVAERPEQITVDAVQPVGGVQVGYKIAVIVRTQPCAIEGKRNCGRAGIGAGCDVEQRTDHVERGIAKGQRDGVAVFFDEAGLGCDDGGGEFLLVDDLACCKAEGVELLPGRGKDQIFSAVENVDYFRDASEGLRGIVPSADGDSEGVLVGPKGLEAVARVSGDGDGEGVVVDAVAAVLDICRCKGDEVVFAVHRLDRGIGNGVLACGFIGEIEGDERRIERIIGPCRRFLNAEGVEVRHMRELVDGHLGACEEILRLRVNEKSRYGTSAIREQPEVGGARLVLEWYCRKRVDVIQIQEDFISEGINDHNAAWPRYIAHNEARRGYGLDKPVSRRNCVIPQLKDVGCCRARKRSVVGVVEGHGSCGVEDGGPGTFLAVGDIYDFPVRFEQIERRPGLLRIGIER